MTYDEYINTVSTEKKIENYLYLVLEYIGMKDDCQIIVKESEKQGIEPTYDIAIYTNIIGFYVATEKDFLEVTRIAKDILTHNSLDGVQGLVNLSAIQARYIDL